MIYYLTTHYDANHITASGTVGRGALRNTSITGCNRRMTNDRHIMFVDDDEEDHLIMSEYFKECGKDKQVRFLKNGQEALSYLENIPSNAPLPSLIVLDLNMPILNGTQTLQKLKSSERFRNIPVKIFSTSENEGEKRKCLNLGADEYLVKPTTYMDGLRMVQKFSSYLES